jgi:hypothetical protein
MRMARPAVHTDIWTDAQVMAAENPDTFEAPSSAELRALHPGSVVKVHNGQERFWVMVTGICPHASGFGPALTAFRGRVMHRLVFEAPYDRGDTVEFEGRHIYAIQFVMRAPLADAA